MATVDSGLKDLVWADKETGLNVSLGAIADTTTDSPYVSVLDGTSSLLADQIFFSFEITASTAALIALVYAIFSEDSTENPPTGANENKKILVASLSEDSPGTIARSNVYAVPVMAKYFRLAYQNDGTAQITIASRYAKSYQQSYSA